MATSLMPDEQTQGYMNPNRALWGGTLMDIGNFLASRGQSGFQGTGTKMMMAAQTYNENLRRYQAGEEVRGLQKRKLELDIEESEKELTTPDKLFEGKGVEVQMRNILAGIEGGTIDPTSAVGRQALQWANQPDVIPLGDTGNLVRPRVPGATVPDELINQAGVVDLGNGAYLISKRPSEAERRGQYVATNLIDLNRRAEETIKAEDFNPSDWENLAPGAIEALVGGVVPGIGNVAASPGWQQYKAASDEWASNLVFLRSGATARQEEKDTAFTNFWPQPFDDEATRSDKKEMRDVQMRSAIESATQAGRISPAERQRMLDQLDEDGAGGTGAPSTVLEW